MSAPNAAAQAKAQAANLAGWLRYARPYPWSQLGTLLSATPGGAATGQFVLNPGDIPVDPGWCSAINYDVSLALSLTIPAGGSVVVSPFFPFSAIQQALTLAGAPPWVLMELTPWWLDNITRWQGRDPSYAGLGQSSPVSASTSPYQDDGGLWSLGGLVPGATVSNAATAPVTTAYTVKFRLRQQLQRHRHLGYGLVPFGDDLNRPQQKVIVANLVGNQPEQNAFVSATAGVTCTAGTASTLVNTYELKALDILPPNLKGTFSPVASMGLQVDVTSPAIPNAGAVQGFAHKTAMVDQFFHHLLINNQLPIRADYFGLWRTGTQQNARWQFDASTNTFNDFYRLIHERYGRYMPLGYYPADLVGGDIPQLPNVSPALSEMTPDLAYASEFGIAPTPAQMTALRIPSGTTIAGAYTRIYSFGLVSVPY